MTKVSEIHRLIAVVNDITQGLGHNCTAFGNALLATLKECDDKTLVGNLRLLWRITIFSTTDDPQEPLEPQGLLAALDHSIVQLLAEHRKSLDSVDLQARILDVAQALEAPGPRKRQLVSEAWDAYQEAAEFLLPIQADDIWVPYFHRIRRSAQLSLLWSHNRTETLDKLCEAIERTKDTDSFLLLKLAELALNFRDVDKARLFVYLQTTAERAWGQDRWEMCREYLNVAMKCLPAEQRRPLLIRTAETYEAEASSRESSLAACHFIEQAIRSYRQAGGAADEVDRLHRRLLELGKKGLQEMQSFEEEVDLSKIVQSVNENLAGKDFADSMITLGRIILQQGPRKQNSLAQVKRHSQEFVFSSLMPPKVFDSSGRVIRRGELENDDARLRQDAYAQTRQHFLLLAHGIIDAGRVAILGRHRVLQHDIEEFFSPSPFIVPGQERLFCKGLYEGFKGNYDVASHLLVPQLEAGIRHLLEEEQVFVSRLDKDLFQDRYLLGSLLANEELEKLLGEDLVFTLKALLNEKAGENFRNRLCHGLLNDQEIWSPASVCVWGYSLAFAIWPLFKQLEAHQTSERCRAKTQKGTRCRNRPAQKSQHCHIHRGGKH